MAPNSVAEDPDTITDRVLSIAEPVVEGLRYALELTGIPGISVPAKIALELIKLANDRRRNTKDCRAIIRQTCELTFCVYDSYVCKLHEHTIREGDKPYTPPTSFIKQLVIFSTTVQEIRNKCQKLSTRRRVIGTLSGGDKDTLRMLSRRLDFAKDKLQLAAVLDILRKTEAMQGGARGPQVKNTINMKARNMFNIAAQNMMLVNNFVNTHITINSSGPVQVQTGQGDTQSGAIEDQSAPSSITQSQASGSTEPRAIQAP